MSEIKHQIFFGFKETEPIDGPSNPINQTYYLLAENGDNIVTENEDKLMTENG